MENSEVVQIKVQLDVSDFSSDIVSAVGAVETAVNNLMYVNIVDING